LSHTSIYVLDQDRAKAFYTEKLGFELRQDVKMGDFRWLTVGPKGQQSRPCGIEALFCDDSGNWFSLTQRHGA
jgi:catechol 2,3-dioxygenase-like lactoylglutathione lyase family enzyme